jgi:putative transposase
MPDPYEIATWRYEQIAFLADESLSPTERKACLALRTRRPVCWPSGKLRKIKRSTLYGWWAAYCKAGRKLEALLPKQRKDLGTRREDRSTWIQKAVHLLLERPARTLYMLVVLLQTYFPGLRLCRATLDRELKAHPAWPVIQRERKGGKRHRTRFRARAPHDIWQLDAKGPFTVLLTSGEEIRVVVLTILDDHSSAVLGVAIAESESIAAAVRLVRDAVARWGPPHKVYCDRHSVYDSAAFRTGVAELGIHRIWTTEGNPPPRGKIEAYHRVLTLWFVDELPHQQVVDRDHLLELLLAVIDVLYMPHPHRGLKMSPAQALADRVSDRRPPSVDELRRAFWVERTLKTHRVTGEVDLPGGLFLVPAHYAGQRVRLRYDPAEPHRVVLVTRNGIEIPVRSAKQADTKPAAPRGSKHGAGQLQRLLDVYHGRELPIADPGFGFAEFFDALAQALGRPVPQTEEEAAAIQAFYREKGPFAPDALQAALLKAMKALGPKRPVKAILVYITRLIVPAKPRGRKERA